MPGAVAVGTLAMGFGCSGGDAAEPDVPRLRETPASCGTATGGDAAGEEPARRRSPVEVTLWHGEAGDRRDMLHRLVREYDRAHPAVTVDPVPVAGGRQGAVERWRETDPAHRPSLLLAPQDATRRLADSGQTVAPGRCLRRAVPDLLPVLEASWSVGGTAQAVPFGVSTPVMFYNRDLFAASDLDPDDPPATLAEVRQAARDLVSEGGAATGLVFNTAPTSGGAWVVNQWSAQAGAPSLVPANGRQGPAAEVRTAWSAGPTADHLAWLRSMVDDGLARSHGPRSGGVVNLAPLFTEDDQAGMALFTSPALAELQQFVGRSIGVAPLPGPTGSGSLPGGTALWLSAGRPAAETRAAWGLVSHLASPGVQSRWAATQGYIPVRRAAVAEEPLASAWAARPDLAVPYEVLADQGTAPVDLGPSSGPQRRLDLLVAGAVEAAVEGESTPHEALAVAAADADHILEVYGEGL